MPRLRHPWSALAIVLSVAVMLASAWAVVPAAANAVALSETSSTDPAQLGQPCSVDPARDLINAATLVASTQCVADVGRVTRGFIRPECIIDNRATVPNATYNVGECKGKKTFQGEAVAQARAIAQLNQRGVYGDSSAPGAITTNLQWETLIPGGRVDLLLYNRRATGTSIGLVEVKGTWNGGAGAAQAQLTKYLSANSGGLGGRNVVAYDFAAHPFTPDTFEIARCGDSATDPHVNVYTTTSAGNGVLRVTRTRQNCGRSNGSGSSTTHTHTHVDVAVGVDSNPHNGNDDFFDELIAWATAHGMRNLVQMLPTNVTVGFREPLHIRLTSRQIKSIIYSLTTLALAIKPAAAGRAFLNAVEDGASGDLGGLAAGLGSSSDTASGIGGLLTRPPAAMPAVEEFEQALQSGTTITTQMIDAAAEELAPQLEVLAQEQLADLLPELESVLTATAEGASLEEAMASAGLSEISVDALEALFVSGVGEEGLAAFGAMFPGLGLLIIAGILATAITWYLWNLWGDPHLVTLDGLKYDLQSVGEFHLVEIPDHDVDVQGRFEPWGSSTAVSVMTSMAFRLGETPVEIRDNGDLYIDGDKVEPSVLEKSGFNLIDDDFGLTYQSGRYTVVFPTGEVVLVQPNGSYINASINPPPGITTRGLLGNHDGVAGNDLQTSDGEQISATNTSVIHGRFADSWRLTDDDSLFTYADGDSTATYTDETFPSTVTTIADFPPDQIEAATTTCRSGGSEGHQLDDCVLDLLLTGDERLANAAAATRDDVVDPLAKAFDQDGVLDEDFTAPVAKNFASSTYLSDPATSRVAGPIYDTPGYSFYALDVPRHHRLDLTLDLVAYGPIDTDETTQSVDVKLDDHAPVQVPLEGEQAPTSITDPATVTRVGTGTTATGTLFTKYRLQVTSAHVGTALKVSLTPHGFRGVLGTALGVNHVRLQLTTTPPDIFNVSLPFTVSNGQPSAGAGNLESPGAEDDYTFHLGDTTTNLLFNVDTCLDATVALVEVSSGNVVAPDRSGCGSRVFNGLHAGDYKLRIWAPGDPRTYGFTLTQAPDPQSFDYQIGQRISDGQIGDAPAPGAGDLESVGSWDSYSFVVDQTTNVLFVGSGGSCSGSQLVQVSTAMMLGSVCGTRQTTLTPGSYRIDVPESASAPAGSYWIESYVVPDDAMPDKEIATDGTSAVTALGIGKNQTFTFNAVEGDRYRINVPATTMAYSSYYGTGAKLQVYAPDGTKVYDQGVQVGTTTYVESAQAGVYKIVVDPQGDTIGTATVRVKDASDQILTVPTDGSDAAVALEPGQNAQLSFTAVAGNRYRIRVPATTMPYDSYYGTGSQLRVYGPDGTKLFDQGVQIGTTWYVESAQAGTYKIVLDPQGETQGTATLRVKDATNKTATVPTDGSDTPVTLEPGQNEQLSFTAVAGNRYRITVPATTMQYSSYYGTGAMLQIYAPDGSKLFDQGVQIGTTWYVESAQAGTYKIVLDPQGETEGTATVRVKDATDKQTTIPTDGSDTAVSLEPGQNAQLTFIATAGNRYRIRVPDTTMPYSSYYGTGAILRVYAPDGTKVYEQGAQVGTTWYVESAQAGTYKVVVDPQAETEGTATLRIKDASDKMVTVPTDGSDTPVTLEPGQNEQLSFTAVAGNRYRITVPATTMQYSSYYGTGAMLQIYAPDGSKLFDQGVQIGTTWYVESAQAGTYKIVLDPQGETEGTATVRVKDATDKQTTVPTDGSDTAVALDPGQNAQLSFTATAGVRYRIKVPATTMAYSSYYGTGAIMRVYSPDGSKVYDQGIQVNAIWYVESAQAGVYKIVIDPQGESEGSATIRVKQTSDYNITVPTDGSDSSFYYDPGQNSNLSFAATGGSRYRISVPATTMAYSSYYGTGAKLQVYAPDGTKLFDQGVQVGTFTYVESAQAGIYKVVVDPQGESEGTATVRVQDATDKQLTVPTDGSDTAVALDPGQNEQLSFTATAGNRYRINVPATTMGYSNYYGTGAKLQVYAPDGSKLYDQGVQVGTITYVESAQAGTYKIVIDPQGESTGSATVRVKDATDKTATVPSDGSDTAVALDPGQNEQLSFTATAGNRYRINVPATTMGYSSYYGTGAILRIYAPDGTKLYDQGVQVGTITYVEPAQAGTYKIVIDPQGESTGSATVRVKDISDLKLAALTDGSDNSRTLEARQNLQVSFTAAAGKRYRLSVPTATIAATDERIRVIAPDGTSVVDVAAAQGWVWYLDSAQAGTYTVIADPNGDVTGTVNIQVKDVSTPTPSGAYATDVLADQPSAWYRMNDTDPYSIADSSGNGHNGQSISPLLGRTGLLTADSDTATEFDGANDHYARIPNATWMQSPHISVEAWVKADTLPAQSVIAGRENWSYSLGSRYSWLLGQRAGKLFWDQLEDNGATIASVSAPTAMVAGQTYHVVATYDGATIRLFVNGQGVASTNQTGALSPGLTDLTIGRPDYARDRWDGIIDDVAVYPQALSAARVAQHYASGSQIAVVTPVTPTGSYASAILADQPSAWYRLSDQNTDLMADSSGNFHGGQWTNGLLGRNGLLTGDSDAAAEFDGSDRQGRVANNTWLQTPNLTVEAWIKADTLPAQSVILARENWSYSYSNRYSWILLQRNGKLYWEQFENNGATPTGLTSSTTMVAGQTYHVAVTYDGSITRMYINGQQVGTVSVTGALSPGLTDLTIGRPDYPRDYFDGIIDDVALYPQALTASRIAAHYAAGTGS